MDQATIIMYVVQALGGIVGGNILGALTRGGGGVVGRTIFGAIGGLAAGWAATSVPAVSNLVVWDDLIAAPAGTHLSNLITGGIGGGLLGLITGVLVRPRG
jgi:hypothetical protein